MGKGSHARFGKVKKTNFICAIYASVLGGRQDLSQVKGDVVQGLLALVQLPPLQIFCLKFQGLLSWPSTCLPRKCLSTR